MKNSRRTVAEFGYAYRDRGKASAKIVLAARGRNDGQLPFSDETIKQPAQQEHVSVASHASFQRGVCLRWMEAESAVGGRSVG